jgi:hypothetical protein
MYSSYQAVKSHAIMSEKVSEYVAPWWAEQMSCFPEDDEGVPRFCHHKYCPLHHDNPVTNDNDCARKISPFGYKYFDLRRKIFFGFAGMFTIFAFFMTIWGCFALSTSRSIVQRTYWTGGTGSNTTSGQEFSMYVGLRSVELVNCSFVPGYESYSNANCKRESVLFTDSSCKFGIISSACEACADVAISMW